MCAKTLYEDELKGMLSPVKFYENPVLTPKHEIRPGQLIEALPLSFATFVEWPRTGLPVHELEKYFISDYPTNVFGYVRGEVKDERGVQMSFPKETEIEVKPGDFAVERIMPFGLSIFRSEFFYRLCKWAPDGENAYLVVGEVKALPALELTHIEDDLTEILYDRGVVLLPEQLEIVRKKLYDFIRERRSKNLVFTAPDTGNQYPLEEIVLSLGPKE